MNILILCDEYPPGRHGGLGTVVQLIARTLVKTGHKVIVAGFYHRGYGGPDEFEDNGVKVYRFRQKFASPFFENQDSVFVRGVTRILTKTGVFEWDIKASLKNYGVFLNKLIADYSIDIVDMPDYHDYMRFCNHIVHYPALNAPTIVKLNGSMTYFNDEAGRPTPKHIWEMEKAILDRADAVVSVSQYTATKTAECLEYDGNIAVLYNGINLPDLPADVTKTKGKVVFTGSLVQKKGIYQLMKAWNMVVKQKPYARLYIFGKGPIDKIASTLTDDAKKTVFFKGHVDRAQLSIDLTSAEIAIFPSYAECFALAPLEAMAHATAVIFSTRTSGPELIESGKNGLLADPDDVTAIAEDILLLLGNEELNTRFAKMGRETVERKFDINIIAQQHIDFYNSVLSNAGR